MTQFLRISILVLILTSCNHLEDKPASQVNFTTRLLKLNSDTTISSIAVIDEKIVCLQNNGKLLILDTAYNRQDSLESKLNIYKDIDDLFTLHDTVFVGIEDKIYFIDKGFNLKEFTRKRRIYGDNLFEDSSYYVYGCCGGEFGGAVFFLNKKTNRSYSYFATCATQVIRFNNEYVVCNNLAHLGRSMYYLFVPEPTQLYELTDEDQKNHCNWYVTVDSLKGYWRVSPVGGVRYYRGPYGSMSLVTFPFKDSLYSVICNDSSTFIAVHGGDTTLARQTIIDKPVTFHDVQVITAGRRQVCLYILTQGSPLAAYVTRGNNSGLLVVENNRIDMLTRKPL